MLPIGSILYWQKHRQTWSMLPLDIPILLWEILHGHQPVRTNIILVIIRYVRIACLTHLASAFQERPSTFVSELIMPLESSKHRSCVFQPLWLILYLHYRRSHHLNIAHFRTYLRLSSQQSQVQAIRTSWMDYKCHSTTPSLGPRRDRITKVVRLYRFGSHHPARGQSGQFEYRRPRTSDSRPPHQRRAGSGWSRFNQDRQRSRKRIGYEQWRHCD